jgi:excisionase family DNA binding protein
MRTVQQMLKRGKLPITKIGGEIRIERLALDI